jgi:beta-glucosidase
VVFIFEGTKGIFVILHLFFNKLTYMQHIEKTGGEGIVKRDKFFWGVAISSYQVEGGNDLWSDWGDWKMKAGMACDFWRKYEYYLTHAQKLGINAFRFSIEWARVEPEENKWNEKDIKHYRQIILKMKDLGLEPFLTLWHFTLPKWIQAKSGWANKKTILYFSDYIKKMVEAFGDLVYFWIVINEPSIVISHGYIQGDFPPGKRFDVFGYLSASRNIEEAVLRSYEIIHSENLSAGCAFNINKIEPAREFSILDKFAAWVSRNTDDRRFIRALSEASDFIGINYYMRLRVRANLFSYPFVTPYLPPNVESSDLGWEIYPEGLTQILLEIYRNFNRPIVVTENGIADSKDVLRPNFIRNHIEALKKAKDMGADIFGYFHWALMDNFEWMHGFGPRFGLYEMDYSKMEMRAREESVRVYKEIISNSKLF